MGLLSRYADKTSPPESGIDAGGMTAAQLAEDLDLHVTTVRFHLHHLEDAGLVVSHFTAVFGVGRPRKVFALAPAPETETAVSGESHHKRLAALLATSYSSGLSPEDVGERWADENIHLTAGTPATTPGAWLSKMGQLVDILGQWGYGTNVTTTDGGRSCRIDLFDCPFMDVARANPDVVCGIHRGLLTGTLNQLGEDQVDVSLQPFVGPRLCHARIRTDRAFQSYEEESPDEP